MAKTNISSLVRDVQEYLEGGQTMEGGRAALALDLVPYLDTPIVYKYATKDGTEYTDDFKVADIVLNKPRNEDGSESSTLQSQRRTALLVNLFGFEAFNIPDKMRSAIDRMIPEAIALRHFYGREDGSLCVRMVKVPGDIGKSSKRVVGGVPASDMFALVDAENKLTTMGRASLQNFSGVFYGHKKRVARDDMELAEFMVAFEVEATGKANSFFRDTKGNPAKALTSAQFLDGLVAAARDAKVLPAKESRNTNGKRADKATDIASSAKLIAGALDKVMASDESDIDFSPELETLLDTVAERWAAYRCRFPKAMI